MIEPIQQSHTITVDTPLPPCWLRVRPTKPDTGERAGAILRVGPGGELHWTLIAAIGRAQEVVLAASFLFADEELARALLDASSRGVRVYVLTASENRVASMVREDDSFEAKMVNEHKHLLDRLAGNVLLRSAEHFHAKFLIIDPQHRPQGWLSTANFNLALRESVELAIELDAARTRALADWFNWIFWTEAERELVAKGRLAKVKKAPRYPRIPTSTEVLVTTSRHTTISQEALRLIEQAQTEILVSSYGLSADHDVVKSLVRKARSGVPVTLVTRPRPAVQPAVSALCAAGARVLAHDKLHAKAIVTDAGAMIMSANLEAGGLDRGFEVGVRLTDAEATSLRSVLSTWAERFPWQFESNAPRTRHLGEICLADRGLRDGLRHVIEEAVVHLEAVTADDALRLDAAPRPALKEPPPDEYPQRVRYKWQVRPPTLPRKATQRLREVEETQRDKDGKEKVVKRRVPFEPPVHEHAGQTYVVLRQESDKEVARRLADELVAKVVLP